MTKQWVVPPGIPLPRIGDQSKVPGTGRESERFRKTHYMLCTDVDVEKRTITLVTLPKLKRGRKKRR